MQAVHCIASGQVSKNHPWHAVLALVSGLGHTCALYPAAQALYSRILKRLPLSAILAPPAALAFHATACHKQYRLLLNRTVQVLLE